MSDRMSERTVASLRRHGRHRVSDNLYLQVGEDGRRSWVFRYQLGGKAHMMGLGSAELRTLAEARDLAHQLRRQLHLEGSDPLQHRRAMRAQAKIDDARSITFADCTARFLETHRAGWRSAKHAKEWEATLREYAFPIIGEMPVASIDTDAVMRVLEQGVEAGHGHPARRFWEARTETASRVRGRIEGVLDWAKVRGHRDGDNCARWRGHLDKMLPRRSRVRKVEHLAAMSYAEVPELMRALRNRQDVASAVLRFIILTCLRLNEALGARWSEIDLDAAILTVPAERTKAGKEHRVPLSREAVELLRNLPRDGDLIFHYAAHPDRKLHHSEPLKVLKNLTGGNFTVHGTARSTFSTWAHETTTYPSHIIEMALAHTVGSAVERAYQRSDLFSRRRQLMEAWGSFLAAPPVKRSEVVVPLARA
jgi:integrase